MCDLVRHVQRQSVRRDSILSPFTLCQIHCCLDRCSGAFPRWRSRCLPNLGRQGCFVHSGAAAPLHIQKSSIPPWYWNIIFMASSNMSEVSLPRRWAKKTGKAIFEVFGALVLCALFCLTCGQPVQKCGTMRHKRRQAKEEKKRETAMRRYWSKKTRRNQRQFERRNSLSLELASPKYKQQSRSNFFQRIPVEIRQMIYAYVWDDQAFLHIEIGRKQFYVPECIGKFCSTEDCLCLLDCAVKNPLLNHARCVQTYSDNRRWVSYTQPEKPSSRLALLMSCRQM